MDTIRDYQEDHLYSNDYESNIKAEALARCTHPVSTVCSDDDIYAIICDDCGKQFTERQWCEYKEEEYK